MITLGSLRFSPCPPSSARRSGPRAARIPFLESVTGVATLPLRLEAVPPLLPKILKHRLFALRLSPTPNNLHRVREAASFN